TRSKRDWSSDVCSSDLNKYKSFEMINTQDPLDERALIEQTMSKQQKLLKPGFITEQSNWKNGFELFSQRTSYNQRTEKFNHKVRSKERRVGKKRRCRRG